MKNSFARIALPLAFAVSGSLAVVPAASAADAPSAGAGTVASGSVQADGQSADGKTAADNQGGESTTGDMASSFASLWNIILGMSAIAAMFGIIFSAIQKTGALDGLLAQFK